MNENIPVNVEGGPHGAECVGAVSNTRLYPVRFRLFLLSFFAESQHNTVPSLVQSLHKTHHRLRGTALCCISWGTPELSYVRGVSFASFSSSFFDWAHVLAQPCRRLNNISAFQSPRINFVDDPTSEFPLHPSTASQGRAIQTCRLGREEGCQCVSTPNPPSCSLI